MSPRDDWCHHFACRAAVFFVCCGFVFLSAAPAISDDHENKLLTGIFDVYETFISPIDGDRCPMYPSCSHYTKASIEKHGVFVGWIMGMDRLVRCGGDEKTQSPVHFVDRKRFVYDPVANNDFWWSDK